jgi:hypothetical protein
MSFVQIIQFETTEIDEIRQLDEEWYAKTAGHRTVRREILTRDRSNPDRYMAIVEFDSYKEAMRNSQLPETTAIANAYERCAVGQSPSSTSMSSTCGPPN